MIQDAITRNSGVEKTLSVNRHEIPLWTLKEFDTPSTSISQLEVTSSTHRLYDALSKYFAQRAVDIDEIPPTHSDRIHKNPMKDEREYPGKLTSLQNPPLNFTESWRWLFRDDDENSEDDEEDDENSNVTYTVGYGWGKVRTNQVQSKTSNTGDKLVVYHHYARGEPVKEGMILTVYRVIVLYATSDGILKTLCRDALSWYHEREKLVHTPRKGKYLLYTLKVSNCGDPPEWVCHGQRPSRPVSSIVLAPGMQEALMSDAKTFFDTKTKDWYYSHGVPYRRSYLLYGPPGTGKTSTVCALAGDRKLKACFLSLSHKNFGDHTLVEALSNIPKPCVIVFEDIDALFDGRENISHSALTFSGLLNAVDGMTSMEGTLIMMTTNHKDRLDPALLRCGRIDRQFEFPLPGHAEIARYYTSYYPEAPSEFAVRFADAVCARKEKRARSLATLQQHFIYVRGESAEAAVEKIDEFFKSHFPNENKDVKKLKKVGVLGSIPIIGRFFRGN